MPAPSSPAGHRFHTTRWSLVAAAGGGEAGARRAALAWLCERCWGPLRAHVRRRGFDPATADDLTQDFLLAVLEGGVVERADRSRGRFRTFLLACLEHHLGHHREREAAAKRGGDRQIVSLPEEVPGTVDDPAAAFDREWAEALVARVRDRLARESEAAGQGLRHRTLEPFLTRNGTAETYAAAGAALGLGEGAVKVAVHRLRERYRTILREEVAETLAEPDPRAIDGEIAALLEALGRPGGG